MQIKLDTRNVSGWRRAAVSHGGSQQGAALLSMGAVYFALPGGVLHGAQRVVAHVRQVDGHRRELAGQERVGVGQLRHGGAHEHHRSDSASHTHLAEPQVRLQAALQAHRHHQSAAVRPPPRQLLVRRLHARQGGLSVQRRVAALSHELVLRLPLPLVRRRVHAQVPGRRRLLAHRSRLSARHLLRLQDTQHGRQHSSALGAVRAAHQPVQREVLHHVLVLAGGAHHVHGDELLQLVQDALARLPQDNDSAVLALAESPRRHREGATPARLVRRRVLPPGRRVHIRDAQAEQQLHHNLGDREHPMDVLFARAREE